MTLKEIEKELTSLSLKDLESLKSKIEFLISLTPKTTGVTLEQQLLETIATKLVVELNLPVLGYGIIKSKKPNQFSKLKEVTAFLDMWLGEVLKKKPDKRERMKCYKIFTEFMTNKLLELDIPVSLTTILNCYEWFPSLFEKFFPGYIKSGLVRVIFETYDKLYNMNLGSRRGKPDEHM